MQAIEGLIELSRRGQTPDRFRPLIQELDSAGLLTSEGSGPPPIAGVIELYNRGVLNDRNSPDFNRDLRRQYLPIMHRLVTQGLVTPYVPQNQRDNPYLRLSGHGTTFGLSDEIRGGLGAVRDVITGDAPSLSEGYDYNLAVQRENLRQSRRQAGPIGSVAAEVVGGFASPAMAASALPAGATVMQRARQFGTHAAGYGAVQGFGEAEGGVGNRIEGTAVGAGIGAGLGFAGGAALARGGDWIAARRAAADARRLEASAANQNAMAQFTDAGVPAFAPAVVNSPTMQTTAESLMGSVMGGPLVRRATETVNALENNIASTIAGAGGRRAADDMGADVQQLLRRNLTEYSVPNAEVNRMTAAQAERITQVPTGPGYVPPRPRAEPVPPVEVQPVQPRQLTIDDVPAPAVRVDPEPVRTNYRPFESVTLEEVNPQLAQRLASTRAELEGVSRIHNERILPAARQAETAFRRDMNGLFRSMQADDGFAIALRERGLRNVDDFINIGLGDARSAFGPGDPFRLVRARYAEIEARYRDALRPYTESQGRYEALAARARELEAQGERARDQGWRLMVQNEHGNAVRRAQDATTQRRIAAETSAREEALRKAQAAEADRATQETARMRGAARSEADRATRARQAEIDARYDADMQNYTPRFEPGRSREHTYPTEFAAAYRQAEAHARGPIGHYMAPIYEPVPPVRREIKVGPLRTSQYEEVAQKPIQRRTATMNLVNDFGREARSAGLLRGWKDGDFNAPELWSLLRDRLGREVADRLQDGLSRTTVGRLPIEGLRDIRTMVRRTAEARPVEGVNMNDRAMLRRLHGAMSEDMQTMLRMAGRSDPAYTIAADQYRMIDTAYERFVTEFRRPLRAVFGENVSPEQALRRLQSAAQAKTQDLQLLRNAYRVATEKGDVRRVTGILLSDMAEGGLPGFIKRYGGLSTEAKRIMFAGNASELGSQLERFHALARRMEPYIVEGGGVDLTKLARLSNVSLAGIGLMVNVPAAIGQALGMHAMARLLASDRFMAWLTKIPATRQPTSPQFRAALARVSGIVQAETGLPEQAWQSLMSRMPTLVMNPQPVRRSDAPADSAPASAAAAPSEPEHHSQRQPRDVDGRFILAANTPQALSSPTPEAQGQDLAQLPAEIAAAYDAMRRRARAAGVSDVDIESVLRHAANSDPSDATMELIEQLSGHFRVRPPWAGPGGISR